MSVTLLSCNHTLLPIPEPQCPNDHAEPDHR